MSRSQGGGPPARLVRWLVRLPRGVRPAHLLSLVGGGLAFLSLPPIGWWPAGVAGAGILFAAGAGAGARRRIACGYLFGAGLLVPGMFWVIAFTGLGYPIVVLVEASFYALAVLFTPPGRGRLLAFPAAMAGAEMLRDVWPFGGVPLSELSLGQAGGPLAEVARLGGSVAVTGVEAALGAGLAAVVIQAARDAWPRVEPWGGAGPRAVTALDGGAGGAVGGPVAGLVAGLVAVVLSVAAVTGGALAPDGGPPVGRLEVAAVQGGGVRGLRAVDQNPAVPFLAQVRAMSEVKDPVHLIVWPENVLELTRRLDGSPQDAEMRRIAETQHATVLAGVTQPVGATRFLNGVYAWTPDGRRIGPYEKVHRVPFGEYVPFRSFLSHFANLSDVPRDAIPGHGPGYLVTPAGRIGVMISFEVFFDERALAAVGAGARILTVPTNAASYRTGQVPSMEVAAARLRAIGTGRDLVQAAPTGYSALVNNRGRVLARTSLGAEQVLESHLSMRAGLTFFDRTGLWFGRFLAGAMILAAWLLAVGDPRRVRRV